MYVAYFLVNFMAVPVGAWMGIRAAEQGDSGNGPARSAYLWGNQKKLMADDRRAGGANREGLEFGLVEDEWDADSEMGGIGIAAVLRWIGLRSSRNAECMPGYRECGQESASEARGKRGHGLERFIDTQSASG